MCLKDTNNFKDTNDLKDTNNPTELANNIIELTSQVNSNDINLAISGIVPRGDQLNNIACEVNNILKEECGKRNISFLDNSNINTRYHLNYSRLHLNQKGIYRLMHNFVDFINSMNQD